MDNCDHSKMDSLGHWNFEGWVKYLVIIRSGKWLLEDLRLENFNAFPFHAVLSHLCTLSAARISMRLLGSPLTAQEASVGARGCCPGNWRLPPLRRCGLGTPLVVPATPCPLALFQERQPGLRFLFLSAPCPLDFQPRVMLISAEPPRLGVLVYTPVVLCPSFPGWTLQTQRPLRLSPLSERQLPRVLVGALT